MQSLPQTEFLAADRWLSELMQRPAFRLTDMSACRGLQGLLAEQPLFVTAKCAVSDVASVGQLEDAGFRVIDAALTFDAERLRVDAGRGTVRFATPHDCAAVRAIAGRAFRYSRFHLDPAVPDAIAHRIKAAWAENFFSGQRGDGMVVCEDGGKVVGFLQLVWAGETLVIDLIAVAPEAARTGLASAMLGFAAANGTGDARRPSSFKVGTQAANTASCRLYENLGFRLSASAFVLHHHGSGGTYPVMAAT
jgi:ribosomal protein S18 acetylase RimI-like enzyme